MTALANLDNLIQVLAQTGGTETIFFNKNSNFCFGNTGNTISYTSGYFVSLWGVDGFPSRGEIPTTAEICTNQTNGALKQSNASANKEKFLIQFNFYSTAQGAMILYDRLGHMGGLNANITTLQNVNLSGITRYSGTSSVGNRILIEIYQTVGNSVARVVEITYTNQDGTSGRKAYTNFINSSRTGALLTTLQLGDTGVQSVESVQLLGGGTGGAGNFGITIIRPLAVCHSIAAGVAPTKDLIVGLPGIPKILNNACLSLLYLPLQTASTSQIEENLGFLIFIEN